VIVGTDARDVAEAATSVERPSLRADVPLADDDRLELAADGTRLPPDSVAKLTPAVESLVGCGVDEFKVLDAVVLLVAVPVVDLEPSRDGSVVPLPLDDVCESHPSVDATPQVSLSGEVVSVGAARLWPSFSHSRYLIPIPSLSIDTSPSVVANGSAGNCGKKRAAVPVSLNPPVT
jgi:hypothetical protein